MEHPIIEIKNISKKYNITHQKGGYIALRDVLMNIIKSPFAFLKTKTKKIIGKETKEEFWALKDINFTVNKGEVIGIIGSNGAGKSTLLKILSQITPPTTGEIKIHGTVGSLLEVGTGFHPELTGRENIFLNGAILGMSQKDIAKKFDAIVEFAEIDKFLDTPVKHYSSGMYVRLAFSVAAHMEPDILIIDEVLAVGDAEFQKKCLGKMENITKSEGRTILFVSHNMEAIRQLCSKIVLLNKGKMEKIGTTSDVIDYYLNNGKNFTSEYDFQINTKKDTSITKICIQNKDEENIFQLPISEDFYIKVKYTFSKPQKNVLLSILFYQNGELLLLSSESDNTGKIKDYLPGNYETKIKIPAYLFNIGYYQFDVTLHRPYIEYLDNKSNITLEILDINNVKSKIFKGHTLGKIATILNYQTKKI